MELDETCGHWIDTPLAQVIEEAKLILRTEKHLSFESIELLVDSLLTSVSVQGDGADITEVKNAAHLVLEVGVVHASTVGSVLLNRLDELLQPIPFVEIFPSVFGMASPLLLDEVFEQLQNLQSRDNKCILPVINALVDLPLTAELKNKLVALTEEAINIVDESDIPFLFRTLLNNLEHVNASNIAGKILMEVYRLLILQ